MRALRDELRRPQARAAQGVTAEAKYCGAIEHPNLRQRAAEATTGTAT